MSSFALSKIKTARKVWVCPACDIPVRNGEEYFSYQIGQRSSIGYCLSCVRNGRVDTNAFNIYVKKYALLVE